MLPILPIGFSLVYRVVHIKHLISLELRSLDHRTFERNEAERKDGYIYPPHDCIVDKNERRKWNEYEPAER